MATISNTIKRNLISTIIKRISYYCIIRVLDAEVTANNL